MVPHRAPVVAALLSAALLVGGCDGTPGPVKSTSLFATEEEAFAAAEATYRAYVDALNNVDLSDPETFEPVFALTTGESNSNDRKSFTQMSAAGWQVSGRTKVIAFEGTGFDPDQQDEIVRASACIDVSEVQLVDASGQSQVSPDRPPRLALDMTFTKHVPTALGLAVSASENVEDGLCSGE